MARKKKCYRPSYGMAVYQRRCPDKIGEALPDITRMTEYQHTVDGEIYTLQFLQG